MTLKKACWMKLFFIVLHFSMIGNLCASDTGNESFFVGIRKDSWVAKAIPFVRKTKDRLACLMPFLAATNKQMSSTEGQAVDTANKKIVDIDSDVTKAPHLAQKIDRYRSDNTQVKNKRVSPCDKFNDFVLKVFNRL